MKYEKVRGHAVYRAVMIAVIVSLVMLLSGLTGCGKAESGKKTSPSDLPVKSAPFFEDQKTEDSLNAFLDSFVRYHALRFEDEWKYDSDHAAESNILVCLATPESCVDWTMYSDVPENDCFVEKKNDPKKWAVETNAYYVYDAKTVDFIAREIFNVSDSDIKTLAAQSEKEKILYLHKGKYYVLHEDGEYDLYNAEITDVNSDGGYYTVKFDAFLVSDDETGTEGNSQLMYACTARLELKTVDDRQLWSMYSFESEKK